MKGFLEEYGTIIVVVAVILLMLLFGKTGYAKSIQDAILGSADHIVETGENIVPKPKRQSSMLINGQAFTKTIPKTAKSVVFCDEKAPDGVITTDLTAKQDNDVVGWLDGTTWKVSTQDDSKKVMFNTDSSSMFINHNNITSVRFDNIDTSNVENMKDMFTCTFVTSLDLSSFDTSKVTTMEEMFSYCNRLTSLNLSSFDTSNVENMRNMFIECTGLTSLDLSSFDISNVKSTSGMFYNCFGLISLDLSSFDTSNVKNIWTGTFNMFYGCRKLTNVFCRTQEDLDYLSKVYADSVSSNAQFVVKS